MGQVDFSLLKERLDKLVWPSLYMFKFIVPVEKEHEITDIFGKRLVDKRFSKNRRYVSVTSCYVLPSGSDVIEVYRKASLVEGVVSL